MWTPSSFVGCRIVARRSDPTSRLLGLHTGATPALEGVSKSIVRSAGRGRTSGEHLRNHRLVHADETALLRTPDVQIGPLDIEPRSVQLQVSLRDLSCHQGVAPHMLELLKHVRLRKLIARRERAIDEGGRGQPIARLPRVHEPALEIGSAFQRMRGQHLGHGPAARVPMTTMCLTLSAISAYSMAAASDSSPMAFSPAASAGAMMLPTVRTSKMSPGSALRSSPGTTRLSEQANRSAIGFWPCARRLNVARRAGRRRRMKTLTPRRSFSITGPLDPGGNQPFPPSGSDRPARGLPSPDVVCHAPTLAALGAHPTEVPHEPLARGAIAFQSPPRDDFAVGFNRSSPFLTSNVSGAHVSICASTRSVNATATLNVLLAAVTIPTSEQVCPSPVPDTVQIGLPLCESVVSAV